MRPAKGKERSQSSEKGKKGVQASKTPAKGKQSKTPAKGKQSKTPAKGKQSKTPAKGKQSKTPAKGKQSKTPAKRKQSKTPAKGKISEKKKVRLLKVQERLQVKDVNQAAIVSYVHETVTKTLVPSLFPERMELWQSICNTEKLNSFIHTAAEKYISLYDQYSKGKEKYANLYLAWLDYIRSFTCKSQQTLTTLATVAVILAKHGSATSTETQRTVFASILHAVQEGMQSQMAAHKVQNYHITQAHTENYSHNLMHVKISAENQCVLTMSIK